MNECHGYVGRASTTNTDHETGHSPTEISAEELSRACPTGDILVRRWLGTWIDFVAMFGILVTAELVLGNALYQETIVIWLSILVVYFPLLEGLTGQSIGKVTSRTRVVNAQGDRPGIWKATVRTLTRLIEVNPFFAGGLPAGVIVAVSKTNQRWGDVAARTFVLRCKDAARLAKMRRGTGESPTIGLG